MHLAYCISELMLAGTLPWVINVAYVFLIGGLVAVCLIFIRRLVHSALQSRTSRVTRLTEKILNKVIVNDSLDQSSRVNASFAFYIRELKSIAGTSSFKRNVMINQIIDLKKNLTGTAAKSLGDVYHAMGFYVDSRRKVRSFSWEKRALGIRELTEAGHVKSVPLIQKNLRARNEILRQETLVALVRLGRNPLSFLHNYHNDLSPWMCINIYNYLRRIDVRSLPVFSEWFNHPNTTVCIFAIRMTREFRQSGSVAGLVRLLSHPDMEVVCEAVDALGELEAVEASPQVAGLAEFAWHHRNLACSVIRCMGKIGDGTDASWISKFCSHPEPVVQLETVRSLHRIGISGEEYGKTIEQHDTPLLRAIVDHLSEPLLRLEV